MRNLKLLSLLLTLFISDQSVQAKVITHKFEIPYFNTFCYTGSGKIEIKQGDKNVFALKGEEQLIKNIVIDISQGELCVSPLSPFDDNASPNILEGQLTVQNLSRLVLDGNVNVDIDELKGQNLMIETGVRGSTIVEGNIDLNRLAVNIHENSLVLLKGKVNEQMVFIQGSGTFEGQKLTAKVSNVHIQGSGTAYVYPTQKLSGIILGYGHIYYVDKGHLEIENQVRGEGIISPFNPNQIKNFE